MGLKVKIKKVTALLYSNSYLTNKNKLSEKLNSPKILGCGEGAGLTWDKQVRVKFQGRFGALPL